MRFKDYLKEYKDIMLLPVILLLLFVTILMIMNKGGVSMPFVYAGF